MVRELFSLVTSAICVRIAGHRSEVTKIVLPHGSGFSSTAAFLPQWIRRDHFLFICYVNS